ncbi:hypothetical protein [Micromonospora sp. WMMB235]|uniref:hypothetical protein n=1 Tax=Micromonospora sp. WMMB235 TaxID=1172030 RepID=UPI0008DB17A2|nr:hypothetical protein [Micromonospora sp. WMMB235]OHX02520.1 hypothetical protein BFV98_05690 [Micromonospora sp. WMMB235]
MAEAIERRNRLVHSTAEIGEVWREYADGSGGEWVHVITAMGEDDCDEHDLRSDLALQQQATCEAVRLLYFLTFGQRLDPVPDQRRE